ncbi:hypothetical protein M436DRAFT_36258, partial [Aureobasidium namibiae CBS 147.97]
LPWKTHVPLFHQSRVEHYCHGCNWTLHGGLMLWWWRKGAENDEHVDVGKSDEALPEGCEDVKGFKDVVARRKQLDELAAAPADQKNR